MKLRYIFSVRNEPEVIQVIQADTYNGDGFPDEPQTAFNTHVFTPTASWPQPDHVLHPKKHHQHDLLQSRKKQFLNTIPEDLAWSESMAHVEETGSTHWSAAPLWPLMIIWPWAAQGSLGWNGWPDCSLLTHKSKKC